MHYILTVFRVAKLIFCTQCNFATVEIYLYDLEHINNALNIIPKCFEFQSGFFSNESFHVVAFKASFQASFPSVLSNKICF